MSKKESKSKGHINDPKVNVNNPSLSKEDDKKKAGKDKDLPTKGHSSQHQEESKPKKGQKTQKQ
jgi:hypothetical protein